MAVTALESKKNASKSTSNVDALSRAGSHVASVAALEAEVTPRLSHPVLWDKADSPAGLDLVSVADSGEGSMEVAAAVASGVAEVVADSKIVDREAEVALAIKVVVSVVVMVAGVIAIEASEHLHQMPRLDHDQAVVATLATGMVKARQTAAGLLLEGLLPVGMSLAAADLPMTIEDQVRVGTEVVIEVVIDMAVREEATTAVVAEATWSQ
jgi:hypothetical protein